MLGRLGSNCRDKSQWYNDRLRSWHVSILSTPFVFASVGYEVKMHPNVRLTIKAVALDPLRGSLSWVRNLTLWWRSSLADITVATHAPEVTNSKTLNASHPGQLDWIREGETYHPSDILRLHGNQDSRRWRGPNKVAGRTRWQLDRWRQCKMKTWAVRDDQYFTEHQSATLPTLLWQEGKYTDAMRGQYGDRVHSQEWSQKGEWESNVKWLRPSFRIVNTCLLVELESRRHARSVTVWLCISFSPQHTHPFLCLLPFQQLIHFF